VGNHSTAFHADAGDHATATAECEHDDGLAAYVAHHAIGDSKSAVDWAASSKPNITTQQRFGMGMLGFAAQPTY
jgi:hypothetical protein